MPMDGPLDASAMVDPDRREDAAGGAIEAERGHWAYTHEPGVDLLLFWRGHAYFHHHLGTDRDRPYADPVSVPGGPPLTCFAPHDHPWHAGFWFNWTFINRVDYWENGPDGHPEGRLRFDGPERVQAVGDEVCLACTYTYLDPRHGPIARERRELRWHHPQPDGGHVVDCTIRLCARATPLLLDRTPIGPETPWGGYGGLSWRFARGMGRVGGLDACGRRREAIEHQNAAWATLYGQLDGAPDFWAGVAIFDHPSNPRHPTPWRFVAEPGFAYLNPSPLLANPLSLDPRERLVLHYRVWVYPGQADPDRLEAEQVRFAAKPVPDWV